MVFGVPGYAAIDSRLLGDKARQRWSLVTVPGYAAIDSHLLSDKVDNDGL